MARARGVRSNFAAAFESTYGTAPASGFVLLPYSANDLDEERGLLADDTVGNRDPGDHTLDVNTIAGDITVPVDVRAFGNWLKAALGAPTTTEDTGVYTHVFESGGWSIPSFAGEKQLPDVPYYPMFAGCKVNQLQFTPIQRGGLLSATLGVMGQSKTDDTSTNAGTPTEYAIDRFTRSMGAISIDDSAVANIVSAEITYANNLEAVETVTSGGNIGGLDEAQASLAVSITARFDSTTLLAKATAGTPVDLDITLTRGSDESLAIAVPRLYLPVPKVTPITGPQGLQVTFDCMASIQANGDPMLTATLVNDVASY